MNLMPNALTGDKQNSNQLKWIKAIVNQSWKMNGRNNSGSADKVNRVRATG